MPLNKILFEITNMKSLFCVYNLWMTDANIKMKWYNVVISFEISFQFANRGTTLNIFRQGVPQNGCRWKEGRLIEFSFMWQN